VGAIWVYASHVAEKRWERNDSAMGQRVVIVISHTDQGSLAEIHDWCRYRGYEIVACAPDLTGALQAVASGETERIVILAENLPAGLDVIGAYRPRGTAVLAPGAPGNRRRPQRLR
jgi:hypothetical protein